MYGGNFNIGYFFWNSSLTEERKRQIVDQVNSLTEDQQTMIDELRIDAREDEEYNRQDSPDGAQK